jgi:hypothetical protein
MRSTRRPALAFLLLAAFLPAFESLAETPAPLQNVTTQKRDSEPASSTVTGRAFAITKGGDLKPARLATIYLIYHDSAKDSQALQKGTLKTAGTVFDESNAKRSQLEINAERGVSQIGSPSFNQLMTETYMLAVYMRMQDAIRAAVKWASENAEGQVRTTKADEEGNFEVSTSLPGRHLLLIFGRAGMNEAIWMEDVNLEPGKTYKLKVSEPKASYLSKN